MRVQIIEGEISDKIVRIKFVSIGLHARPFTCFWMQWLQSREAIDDALSFVIINSMTFTPRCSFQCWVSAWHTIVFPTIVASAPNLPAFEYSELGEQEMDVPESYVPPNKSALLHHVNVASEIRPTVV